MSEPEATGATTEILSITLLGTGCPVVSPHRHGAANLVRCGDLTVLVDVGSGATQRLVEAGSSGAEIDALLLTHLHSDHLVDFYQFVISSWHQNRTRPQRIFGPPGTRAFVEAQMAAWADERAQRIAFEKRTTTAPFEMEITEFSASAPLIETDRARISAVEVEHAPVTHAFGFVFESGGRKLVLSGDTRACPALEAAAEKADLLVHEVFAHAPARNLGIEQAGGRAPAGGTRSAETLVNVASYHTLSTEVGGIAARADVAALVLTHIVPPDADRRTLIADARRNYDGVVIVGEDLMTIDVTRRLVSRHAVHFSY